MKCKRVIIGITVGIIAAVLWSVVFINSLNSMAGIGIGNTLLSWGILTEVQGEMFPTNAFALLTGKMRMQPIIQCGLFKGKDRAYFVDRREFDGPIQNQVDMAYQYVLEKINMGMQIHGIYR